EPLRQGPVRHPGELLEAPWVGQLADAGEVVGRDDPRAVAGYGPGGILRVGRLERLRPEVADRLAGLRQVPHPERRMRGVDPAVDDRPGQPLEVDRKEASGR